MILKYIRLFLAGLFLIIGTILWIPICMFRPANRGNSYFIANYCSWLSWIFLQVKIKTKYPKGFRYIKNHVIISNHQSNLDIFFVGPIVPRRTVSLGKKEILKIPFFGQMYWLAGNILINRGNHKKAWSVMDKVAQTIKEDNCNVWIMPEGTRSKGRGLLPFKKGPFLIAIKGQLPIQPVVFSQYEKTFDLGKLKPGKVVIEAMDPISTEGMTLDDLDQLMAETRDKMLAHIKIISES